MWELASGFAQGIPNKTLESSKKKENSQIFLFSFSGFPFCKVDQTEVAP